MKKFKAFGHQENLIFFGSLLLWLITVSGCVIIPSLFDNATNPLEPEHGYSIYEFMSGGVVFLMVIGMTLIYENSNNFDKVGTFFMLRKKFVLFRLWQAMVRAVVFSILLFAVGFLTLRIFKDDLSYLFSSHFIYEENISIRKSSIFVMTLVSGLLCFTFNCIMLLDGSLKYPLLSIFHISRFSDKQMQSELEQKNKSWKRKLVGSVLYFGMVIIAQPLYFYLINQTLLMQLISSGALLLVDVIIIFVAYKNYMKKESLAYILC